MAQPNGWNPIFGGRVGADGFNATHGKGISITAIDTSGVTETNVFGSTVGFEGSITGVFLIAKDSTTANIFVVGTDGSVATISTGGTAGAVRGQTALTNQTISDADTLKVWSSIATAGEGGDATVFITYTVLDQS